MMNRFTGIKSIIRVAVFAASVISLVVNGVCSSPAALAAERISPRLEVMAYCPIDYPGDSLAYASLKKNLRLVDTAALFQFTLDWSGRVLGSGDARFLDLAKGGGLKVVPVIHNFVGGRFDGEMVRPSLATVEGRARASSAITTLVLDKGYSGVDIDFEALPPDLRDSLSLFVKNLAGRLHAHGRTLSIAVPAKTRDNPRDSWSGAYDYAAIAEHADRLMIMAYDEHWAGGPSGPIASAGWVERVVDYAVTAAPRGKILLGVPQYSYDWPAAGGAAKYMPVSSTLRLAAEAGAKIVWDSTAQVPHFFYSRGSEKRHVFIENSYSLAFKMEIARSRGLAGVAIWRLGYEEPRTWEVIESYRK